MAAEEAATRTESSLSTAGSRKRDLGVGEVARGALVEGDQLLELGAAQVPVPPGPGGEQPQPFPCRTVLRQEPVDVHGSERYREVMQPGGAGRTPTAAPGAAAASPLITPEAVVLELRTAALGSRSLAKLLDLLIIAAGVGILLFVAVLAGAGGTLIVVLISVLSFLALFGYPALWESLWRGRTPGKATLGLRVVTDEGAPIGPRHAIIRAVLSPVDLVAGAESMLLSSRDRRLGDLVAGTVVLRDKTVAAVGPPFWFSPPPGLGGLRRIPRHGRPDQHRAGRDPFVPAAVAGVRRSFATPVGRRAGRSAGAPPRSGAAAVVAAGPVPAVRGGRPATSGPRRRTAGHVAGTSHVARAGHVLAAGCRTGRPGAVRPRDHPTGLRP